MSTLTDGVAGGGPPGATAGDGGTTPAPRSPRAGGAAAGVTVAEVHGRRALASFSWAHRHREQAGARQPRSPLLDYLTWQSVRRSPAHVSRLLVALDRAGRTVGRVALTVDAAFVLRHGPVGFFGAFDAPDDAGVARALLDAARALARPYGLRGLIGPVTFTTAEMVGVEGPGRSTRPSLLAESVPAYHHDLLTAAGAQPAARLSAYRWDRADLARNQHFVELARRLVARGDYRVRDGDLTDLARELELLRALYNGSFAHHPLSVVLDRAGFAREASLLSRLLPAGFSRVVERHGRPVAFVVMIPDLADAGPVGPVALARLALAPAGRRLALARTRSASVLMMGVDPGRGGRGIGHILVGEIAGVMARFDLDAVTTTWIHEDNRASTALVEPIGAPPERRLSLFSLGEPGGPDRRPAAAAPAERRS